MPIPLMTGQTTREYASSLVAQMGPPLGQEEAYRIEEAVHETHHYVPRLAHSEPESIAFNKVALLRLLTMKHNYRRQVFILGLAMASNEFSSRFAAVDVPNVFVLHHL